MRAGKGSRRRGFLPARLAKTGLISLLPAKIRLYSAPSHTETWLKRPSGGNRADRLVCSHVSGGTNRRIQDHGATRFHHASAARGWRTLWPPVPSLESEKGRVHFRGSQQ